VLKGHDSRGTAAHRSAFDRSKYSLTAGYLLTVYVALRHSSTFTANERSEAVLTLQQQMCGEPTGNPAAALGPPRPVEAVAKPKEATVQQHHSRGCQVKGSATAVGVSREQVRLLLLLLQVQACRDGVSYCNQIHMTCSGS
jgi:hypothetical protein